MREKPLLDRINKYILISSCNCWIWNGALANQSPVIFNPGGHRCVKRILYSIHKPRHEIKGYFKSICNNFRCVNPDHLINRDEYFESLIDKTSYCWIWKGSIKNDYPVFSIKRKEYAVHRLMYERYKGKIPIDKNVCHKCDTPLCVNPDHLWVGSQLDNVKDMLSKGRGNKSHGSNHHISKINEKQAAFIKKELNKGKRILDIHQETGISYGIIQKIKNGETWNHVVID